MKRVNNLYNSLYDINNIIKMTDKVLSKVKNKERREKFYLYYSEHIINIKNRLENKNINLGKYNIFLITDPKCRVIMSQSIEDKIINHLIAEYLLVRVFENKYIDSMCATRLNKGSGYASKLMKKYLNEMKLKYKTFYILKLDIKKYFYNIDHNILKRILKDNIKIGFPLGNIDIVLKNLENLKINYIIIDNKNIINKYENENNVFSNYTSSIYEVININNRIEKIVDKLKSIDSDSINGVLNQIEIIVDKIS